MEPAATESQDGQGPPLQTTVIGIGNLLLKDEGIGIHVIRALQEMALPPGIRLIDGGTSPDLIAFTRNTRKLVIVDAAYTGGLPGTVYRLMPDDLAAGQGVFYSAHEIGIPESLRLMEITGNKPEQITILGIEPAEIGPGLELSKELQQKLPEILQAVLREIGIL